MDFATVRQKMGGIVRRVVWGVIGVIVGLFVLVFLLAPQSLAEVVATWPMLLRVLIVIGFELALSWFLYLRLRREPLDSTVFRKLAAGSVNELEVESVKERLTTVVEKLGDIVRAQTTINNVGGRADVEMDVTLVNRDIDLPEKEKELNRTIQQVIQKQLGLQLADAPRIYLRFEGRTRPSTDDIATVQLERAASVPTPISRSQERSVKPDKTTLHDERPTEVLDKPPKIADLMPDEDDRSTVVDPVPGVKSESVDSTQPRNANPETVGLPDDSSTEVLDKPPKISDLMPDEDDRSTRVGSAVVLDDAASDVGDDSTASDVDDTDTSDNDSSDNGSSDD